MKTDSSTMEIPTDLADILHSEREWHASSYTSKFGRLTLVLSANDDDEKLRRIKIVEITPEANVAYQFDRVKPETDLDAVEVGLVHNVSGNILLVTKLEKKAELVSKTFKPEASIDLDNIENVGTIQIE